MALLEGSRRSRRPSLGPRLLTALGLFAMPGCLLVQPLDDAKDDDEYSAGESGTGGTSATGGTGGGATGGRGGATGGRGGASGGTGGATGGSAGKGGGGAGGSATTGGASGAGGASAAGGSAGSGNTGNVPLTYGPVWTFDDDLQDWAVGDTVPAGLGLDATATHDDGDGEPDDGSVELTLPFDGPDQTIEVGVTLPGPLDLTGETLAARVRLDSGFFQEATTPGAVKLFVKTGSGLTYADGPWTPLAHGEWLVARLPMDAPDYDGGIDPKDVRELGIAFKTPPDEAEWTTGTFHLDTVGWTNAERPACLLDPTLIDDMETPDGIGRLCKTGGRDGGWYTFDDETDGTRMPVEMSGQFPLSELDVPRGVSARAVHVSGGGYSLWGGGVGATLKFGDIMTSTSWDASDYAGISFWARGSGTMWLQVNTEEARAANQDYPGLCQDVLALTCNDHYSTDYIELTDTWTEYVVPFASLRQGGWGHPVPWTYNVVALEFHWGADTDFDFWIDDVRFVERECDDDEPVSCADGGSRCLRGTRVPTGCEAECTQRGYMTASCSAAGCACSDPTDPDAATAIASACSCAGPELDCVTPEGLALLETMVADPQSSTGASLRCYAGFPDPSEADCAQALVDCWSN